MTPQKPNAHLRVLDSCFTGSWHCFRSWCSCPSYLWLPHRDRVVAETRSTPHYFPMHWNKALLLRKYEPVLPEPKTYSGVQLYCRTCGITRLTIGELRFSWG